jgi:hypothetical protein
MFNFFLLEKSSTEQKAEKREREAVAQTNGF